MALLTPTQMSVQGAVITKAAADGAGETFEPGEDVYLLVLNGDASPHTVTVVQPGVDKYGQARADIDNTIAAGTEEALGPFPSDLADPADGLVHITYDAVTSVTRRLVRA